MIQIPFSIEKDLGKEYNRAMARETDDYAIIMDMDTVFLLPTTPVLIDKYVKTYPAALYSGYASRAHPSSAQRYKTMNEGNFLQAINEADRLSKLPMSVKRIQKNLTGFFMVIPKTTWNKYKFKEGIGCWGVDTDYWQQLIKGGETILLMETVYLWHTYRLKNGIKDKSHLTGL